MLTGTLPPEQSEQIPFWTWHDVLVFFALAVPSLLLGQLVVMGAFLAFHVRVRSDAVKLLPAQFLGYAFLFSALYFLLKVEYHRPFWASLRWVRSRFGAGQLILAGVLMAFAVAIAGGLLKTPDLDSPMKKLLSDRNSVILIGIFGVTFGPLCEELAFRGFLQPLLVRSFGALPGIAFAAIPFGVLHLSEYAWSWRHGVLITVAGMGFGAIRHISGSTRAAAITHAAYNFTFFAAYLAAGRNLPSSW